MENLDILIKNANELITLEGPKNPRTVEQMNDLAIIRKGSVAIKDGKKMVKALKACGASVKFTVYPDAGHDAWTETYNNSELYNWFLNFRKEP